MTKESKRYLELLEKRISKLNSLSTALLSARSAMVSFDIDGLESRIKDQENLCEGIRSLDVDIENIQYQCAAHLRLRDVLPPSESDADLSDALARLHQAQASVKELNDAHQAILRRSRVTVTALLNSIRTFEGDYQPVALQQSAQKTLGGERV